MKDQEYYSEFHEYLHKNLSGEQYDLLPDLLGCSPHRRTSILKRPEVARHDEVLFFSRLLGLSVSTLLDQYGLGARGLSQREKELHRQLDQPARAAAVNH